MEIKELCSLSVGLTSTSDVSIVPDVDTSTAESVPGKISADSVAVTSSAFYKIEGG